MWITPYKLLYSDIWNDKKTVDKQCLSGSLAVTKAWINEGLALFQVFSPAHPKGSSHSSKKVIHRSVGDDTCVDNLVLGRYNIRPFSTDGELSVSRALAAMPRLSARRAEFAAVQYLDTSSSGRRRRVQ